MARRFLLVRDDHDVVNAPGAVAEGVLFTSGKVALHWRGHPQSIQTFDNMADLMAVQDRNGITRIQWLDQEIHDTPKVMTSRSAKLNRLSESIDAMLGQEPVTVRPGGQGSMLLVLHH